MIQIIKKNFLFSYLYVLQLFIKKIRCQRKKKSLLFLTVSVFILKWKKIEANNMYSDLR